MSIDNDILEAIYEAADEGGTIQAHQMLDLDSDPRHHTTCNIVQAMIWAGATREEAEEYIESRI